MRIFDSRHSHIRRYQGSLLVAAFGLAWSGVAWGEGETASEEKPAPATLGEVIVTAQRREENLQQVPVAVTALTGAELERWQITELYGVQFAAPSLAIWPVVSNPMTATISMRGQVEPDLVPTYDPAVGLYLDGVYIARATGANLDLVDMERVEVLRGPQGTLFGRNTTGGAINLVVNKPTSLLEGSLQARAGNFSTLDITGVLNVPLGSHDSATRIAVNHTEHSGYGRAVLLGRDLSDEDTNFVRAQLRLTPAGEWTLDLSLDLSSVHTNTQLMTFIAAFDDTNSIPAETGNPYDSLSNYANVIDGNVQDNRAGTFDAQVWGASATLTGELAGFSFLSISAYRRLNSDIENSDQDGTPYDLFWVMHRIQTEYQFSQEFQLHGLAFDKRLDWTAGALYFTETGTLEAQNVQLAPLFVGASLVHGTAENESWAAYLQATAALNAKLRFTAGARYNVDWRQLITQNARIVDDEDFCRVAPELLDTAGVCQATLPRHKFSYVPFTVGIDYAPESTALLYAKVSRGYRAGGYNMRGGTPLDLLTFGPEKVISYEVGAKAELLEERLRTNLALYYTDYDDIQLGQFVSDPVSGFTIIKQNAGRARIQGGELEITALVANLRLTGALGISDGKYTYLEPGVDGVDLDTGLALPETTFSIAADLPKAFNFGQIMIHGDYSWRSDDGDATNMERCGCHTAYGLFNAIVSLTLHDSNLEFALWGRNLADTHYKAQWVDFGDFIDEVPGDPRTYGVSATYRFGTQSR